MRLFAATAGAIALLSGSAFAEQIAKCELTVGVTTYVDGPCDFENIGSGDFILRDGDYFAYVYISEIPAYGYWNGIDKGTHAHDPLGELERHGACWTNDTARVCASR